MPTGKVKWFDPERGFGFVTGDDAVEAYLRDTCLPSGVTTLAPGTRVEYSIADGRRGPQVLTLQVLGGGSVPRGRRVRPEVMAERVESLIKVLDDASTSLQRGRYPENSRKVAAVLRAVADGFDA